ISMLKPGISPLRGCWIDIYPASATVETYRAIDQGKNGVIAAKPDVLSWQKLCPALAHNNVAANNQFAPEFLYTEPLADAVPSVFNAALSFLVSHERVRCLRSKVRCRS